MSTMFINSLLFLTVIGLSTAAALIGNNKIYTPFGQHENRRIDYNCGNLPDLKWFCQTCFNEDLTCRITSCCYDLTLTNVCRECVMNSDSYIAQSNNSTIIDLILPAMRPSSDTQNDGTFNYIPEIKRLHNTINSRRFSHVPGNHAPYKSSLQDSEQQEYKFDKKWYSPYKYILSLFPQRLSYGHSLFLQGLMAQRPKSNHLDKAEIVWIKKSGNYNENLRKPLINISKNEEIRPTKDAGDFVIESNSRDYGYRGRQRRSTLHNKTNEDIKELPFTTGFKFESNKVSDAFNTQTELFDNRIRSSKTKRNHISEFNLVMNKDSLLSTPLADLLAQLYNNRKDLQKPGTGELDSANYFLMKLLLLVSTLKQFAREYFDDM